MISWKRSFFIILILPLIISNFGCKKSGASSDASLASLTVLNCIMLPTFSPATLAYNAIFPSFPRSVRVTAVLNDPEATMTINGTLAASGADVQVDVSAAPNNVVRIIVTAEDGETTRTYVVTVIVEPE